MGGDCFALHPIGRPDIVCLLDGDDMPHERKLFVEY